MAEKVRVALIGAGGFGVYHMKQWPKVARAEVVGVFDSVSERARRVAAEFGIPRVYESLEALLADEAVEAVDVVVPNNAHAPVTVAALEAGKHVLCEKPLAANSADIERMIRARDASGCLLMTAQNFRFDEASVAFKKMVASGRIGEVYYTRAWWLRRRRVPATPGFITRAQSGGGPCVDIGVHLLDLVMHLLDFPNPVSVTGIAPTALATRPGMSNEWGAFDPTHFDVEDFAAAMVRFDSGGALSLEVSWMLHTDRPEEHGLRMYGSDGGGQWPELTFSHERDGLIFAERIENVTPGAGHQHEMEAFCRAVRTRGPSPVPAEQSLLVTRMLEALYESSRSGHEVRLC